MEFVEEPILLFLNVLYISSSLLETVEPKAWPSINKDKSNVYSRRGCKHKSDLATALGCAQGYLPSKYLGLPL